MGDNSTLDVNQSGKSGGDAIGSTYSGSSGLAGDASGVGRGSASGWGNVNAEGTGAGMGGDAMSGAGAIGPTAGDAMDNTSIGSININS